MKLELGEIPADLLEVPTHCTKSHLENFRGVGIYEHRGWLGSNKFDIHGKEIFEGDIVKHCDPDITDERNREYNTHYYVVIFRNAEFLCIYPDNVQRWQTCGATPLAWKNTKATFEVIGHICEEVTP